VHFDDRLTTVLKGALPEGLGASIQWRQIVDLLAQKPDQLAHRDVQLGLTRLHDLHSRVPAEDRLQAISALHGRLNSAPLLVYLCADDEEICAMAVDAAQLDTQGWEDIYPRLSPFAQSKVQSRTDIGPVSFLPYNLEMAQQLADDQAGQDSAPRQFQDTTPSSDGADANFGDAASLAASIGSDVQSDSGESAAEHPTDRDVAAQNSSQIQDLVARIAAYRSSLESADSPRLPLGDDHLVAVPEFIDAIHFETDDEGVINWLSGAPRGAVVGVSIAEPAFDDGPGPDGYGAAAFKQRMPLENARMRLCGAPAVEGDWRMSAIPFFADDNGRFRGYRGAMRRPNVAEDASHDHGVEKGDLVQRERLQQLIHELRTPLNAIIGFSEIIDQQLFGPVSFEYRSLSRTITDEAQRLLAGFEDLDVAAQIDAGILPNGKGETEVDWLFDKLSRRLQNLTDNKQVELNIKKAEPVRAFAIDGDISERIFSRLLSASIILCEPGETLSGDLRTNIGHHSFNQFALSKPEHMRGISEHKLLDPTKPVEGQATDTPLLGLGFSLRLVRNLAQSVSGSLVMDEDQIILTLPAVARATTVASEID